MKYLLVLVVVATITGCTDRFVVGDCIRKKNTERWSGHVGEYKILEAGKNKYRFTDAINPNVNDLSDTDKEDFDLMYKKFECPK